MPYKKKSQTEAQPILAGRRNNTLGEAPHDQLLAIAGLVIEALTHQNAVYLTPGRFGGVQFKVYIEGDQFAEYLELNPGLPDLVEELLDALYDKESVARFRKFWGALRAERLAKAPAAKPEG